MKSFYLLLALIFLALTSLHAQNDTVQQDTITVNKHTSDTTKSVKEFISHQTDALIGSVFGPSKQLSNADSIVNKFDSQPSFGIYKDNYFVLGTEMFHKPTKYNSDVKFQISVMHRITNSTLPLKTYLFLTYTQKAYWDVFQDSFPFRI
ncbi:phospholipase A [Prevotella sp. 10(H)]|uniref:phospholipase A n=1 Tax=Prevotella sp. 10(H) TaxID=1158294 RepID=UPI00068B0F98|nr:phospholipase A [Prevotella sp. 10(H)]